MQDNKLTFGYWEIRGIGQAVRYFLKFLELPFEEKRYTDPQEWFAKDKPAMNSPFANLPYIKDGETAIFESDALYYYAANKANRMELVGKDASQQVQVSMIRSVSKDINTSLVQLFYNKAGFEEQKPKTLQSIAPKLKALDHVLATNPFTTGDSITYIDFFVYETVDVLLNFDKSTVAELPNLLAFHQRIQEIPQIKLIYQNKTYINSAEFLPKPFNGPLYAAWY